MTNEERAERISYLNESLAGLRSERDRATEAGALSAHDAADFRSDEVAFEAELKSLTAPAGPQVGVWEVFLKLEPIRATDHVSSYTLRVRARGEKEAFAVARSTVMMRFGASFPVSATEVGKVRALRSREVGLSEDGANVVCRARRGEYTVEVTASPDHEDDGATIWLFGDATLLPSDPESGVDHVDTELTDEEAEAFGDALDNSYDDHRSDAEVRRDAGPFWGAP